MCRGNASPDGPGPLGSRRRKQTGVVVVGDNSRARTFVGKIQSRPELGYAFRGLVDDPDGECAAGPALHPPAASLKDLETILWQNEVDDVVVALPPGSLHAHFARIEAACEDQGIGVWLLFDPSHAHSKRARIKRVGDETILAVSGTTPGDLYRSAVKRLADIIGSLALLALLSPLFLVVALLVRTTSPGPVFFIQERVGIRKHLFRMYKFRTMVPDAEQRLHEIEDLNEVQSPAFKIRNDPRVTTVGRFLRRTSIDELPQLLNVLKGEMSMVGPRPLAVRDYRGIEQDWQRRRFKVRPGITCLWQCNGRSNVSFDHWMELDMEYIDNWSLLLDLKILLKTVPAVLKGSGAA